VNSVGWSFFCALNHGQQRTVEIMDPLPVPKDYDTEQAILGLLPM